MPSYNIPSLKAMQEKLDARKKLLLQKFLTFRNEFSMQLQKFTEEAIENGLRGVTLFDKLKHTEEILEASLQLNGYDLVVVATDDIYLHDTAGSTLGGRYSFILAAMQPRHLSLQIVFQETRDELTLCQIRWSTTTGPKPFGPPVPTEMSGREAADEVISFFYLLKSFWIENPTLETLLKRESPKCGLGFMADRVMYSLSNCRLLCKKGTVLL